MKRSPSEKDKFFINNHITKDIWEKADIDYGLLKEISDNHIGKVEELNNKAIFISNILQKCPEVHSVRWRIKDPEHLMAKIVRKRSQNNEKYKDINSSNYQDIITDLIGIRVLHLFKYEWKNIQDYILERWTPIENPVAYIHIGDSNDIRDEYKKYNCEIKVHNEGYRSVHYIIESSSTKLKDFSEIQVRTIFEEGWSEIDHRVRYPNFPNNQLVSYFLTIFNKMAASADEMGTFVNTLINNISIHEKKITEVEDNNTKQLEKIEALIKELSDKEKHNQNIEEKLTDLKKEIKDLKENVKEKNNISYINSDYGIANKRFGETPIDTDSLFKSIGKYGGIPTSDVTKAIERLTYPTDDMKKAIEKMTYPTDDMKKAIEKMTYPTDDINQAIKKLTYPTADMIKTIEKITKPSDDITKILGNSINLSGISKKEK